MDCTSSHMNKIDIVMPTMWMVEGVEQNLRRYLDCAWVNQVIVLINNGWGGTY